MKRILIIAALLSASVTPAAALDWRFVDAYGDRLSVSCYHSAYGHNCRSWWNGTGNSARVIAVPADSVPNTNPNWGRGCRSCFDASK